MKIICWDYDGTLVDTEIFYKDALTAFFKDKQVLLKEIDDNFFYENISGHYPEFFMENLIQNKYIKSDFAIDVEEIKKYYFTYFSRLDQGIIKPLKGMNTLINSLSKDKNIIMCITSSSSLKDFIIKSSNVKDSIYDKVFKMNDNIFLCGETTNCRLKPHSDIFIYAITAIEKKYNFKLSFADSVIIVEDSNAGCEAGLTFKKEYSSNFNIFVIKYIELKNNKNGKVQNVDFNVLNTKELYKILKY